jgi:hypothetical protein
MRRTLGVGPVSDDGVARTTSTSGIADGGQAREAVTP